MENLKCCIDKAERSMLVGVLVVSENAFETAGKRKEETKADEKEFELELAVKKSESNFVVFTYETENEKGENETKYECEIYEGGKKNSGNRI